MEDILTSRRLRKEVFTIQKNCSVGSEYSILFTFYISFTAIFINLRGRVMICISSYKLASTHANIKSLIWYNFLIYCLFSFLCTLYKFLKVRLCGVYVFSDFVHLPDSSYSIYCKPLINWVCEFMLNIGTSLIISILIIIAVRITILCPSSLIIPI